MQGTEECPLDDNVRVQLRGKISDSLLVAASNWNDAIQDKHQEVMQENPEAISPIVDLLITIAIGRLFALFSGVKAATESTSTGDGDGIGGAAQGKTVVDAIKGLTKGAGKEIGKEVSSAGKKKLAEAVKAGMGGSSKDAKLNFLQMIRPTVEKWQGEMLHALNHLPDADLVRFGERVDELRDTFTVESFRTSIDSTLERFGHQVLSLGEGTMLDGAQLAWVFDPVSGDRSRRLALIQASRGTMRYRHEDYATRDGAWTFIQWVDDDMAHPAIDRSHSNRRAVLDLQAPGGKTTWTNPDALELRK